MRSEVNVFRELNMKFFECRTFQRQTAETLKEKAVLDVSRNIKAEKSNHSELNEMNEKRRKEGRKDGLQAQGRHWLRARVANTLFLQGNDPSCRTYFLAAAIK